MPLPVVLSAMELFFLDGPACFPRSLPMQALMLKDIGQVELVEMPVPAIQEDQLLIKTGAATICTSDLNDIRSNPFGTPLPVVFGHEGAGTVAAVGVAVQGFRPGDRIATHPVHPCRACRACQEGLEHLCPHMQHFGINLPGTMAEYYVVRQDRARKIPDTVDFPLASLAEPVSVCLEALAQARLTKGGSLLIVGDGPFGVLIARLASTLDLAKIVIAGRHTFRLSFAGQAVQINTRSVADPLRAMQEAAPSLGYDAAILAVGTSQAFSECLQCLKPKGRLVVFSAIPEATPVDLFSVHVRELEIIGACNDQERFDAAVQMLADPRLSLASLITHRLPLHAFRQALRLAESGREEAMKVTLVF